MNNKNKDQYVNCNTDEFLRQQKGLHVFFISTFHLLNQQLKNSSIKAKYKSIKIWGGGEELY